MPFVSPDVKLSVTQFPHKKWKQPSIIARLEPKNLTSPEIIIVGGHLDTIANGGSGANQGADDNASSDSAIFETLRALVKNGFVPKRALEFQWYAAEEIGLRGSAEIADDYSSRKIPVLGMMNFDQLGYVKPGTKEIVAIFTDNGTKENVDFMRLMAKTYSGLEVQDSRCGYACSDHASWFKKGYNAGVASESKFEDSNPNTHSSKDTIDKVNVNHVMAFVRLAIGFMVELSLTK
jgi:leucyl aminopeptidase